MVTFMRCYDKHSNKLAIIENIAISEITWHETAMHIYWRHYVRNMETDFRGGVIICDWTMCETVPNKEWDSIQAHSEVPVITIANTYEVESDEDLIIIQ